MSRVPIDDRYRLDEVLGRGGMASVWRAYDALLDREVAIKRLHVGLDDDERTADRFEREARILAGLSHPNLVRLLDRGSDDQGPYLVLELVEGETLKQRIARDGALPQTTALSICAQVARGLAVAHDAGVVHRDIKAQNVLLGEDGVAKLTDFGIARLTELTGDDLTRPGMLVGSADYISPEQASGEPVDARSDVYSLGAVLYEALTGGAPFQGESMVAVAMQHLSEPFPDPRAHAPVDDHAAGCVFRATRKDPGERFATMTEFAEALEGVTPAEPPERPDESRTMEIALPRRSRSSSRRGGAAALLVALLLLVGGAGWLWVSRDRAPALGPVAPVAIVGVDDLDPEGDGTEGAALVGAVFDADPDTVWYSENYATGNFGNLKQRIGLELTLSVPAVPRGLTIASPTPGATIEVALRDGTLLAEATLGASTELNLSGDTVVDHLQLWITDLADDPQRAGQERRFRVGIGEVAVRGVANTSPDGSVE